MHDVVGELSPVFILIVVGWAARASDVASPEALGHVNRFGYFVLYPAFLFTLSSQATVAGREALPFVGGLLAGFAVMVLLALAMRFLLPKGGRTRVHQRVSRFGAVEWLCAAGRRPWPLWRCRAAADRHCVWAARACGQHHLRHRARALGREWREQPARHPRSDYRQSAHPWMRGGSGRPSARAAPSGSGLECAQSLGPSGDARGAGLRRRRARFQSPARRRA